MSKKVKRLFSPADTYTAKGKALAAEAEELIQPIIKSYIKQGFSPVDVQTILQNVVMYQTTFERAMHSCE